MKLFDPSGALHTDIFLDITNKHIVMGTALSYSGKVYLNIYSSSSKPIILLRYNNRNFLKEDLGIISEIWENI